MQSVIECRFTRVVKRRSNDVTSEWSSFSSRSVNFSSGVMSTNCRKPCIEQYVAIHAVILVLVVCLDGQSSVGTRLLCLDLLIDPINGPCSLLTAQHQALTSSECLCCFCVRYHSLLLTGATERRARINLCSLRCLQGSHGHCVGGGRRWHTRWAGSTEGIGT